MQRDQKQPGADLFARSRGLDDVEAFLRDQTRLKFYMTLPILVTLLYSRNIKMMRHVSQRESRMDNANFISVVRFYKKIERMV